MAETTSPPPAPAEPSGTDSAIRKAGPTSVIIRPLPNIVFLWPSAFLAAPLCAGIEIFWQHSGKAVLLFFAMLFFNLVVMTFHFNRIKVLTLLLSVVIAGLLLFILNQYRPGTARGLWHAVGGLTVYASAGFYLMYMTLAALLFLFIFLSTRFDYWEITNNELIHHHGVLGDVERFPAPNLRVSKEINDVFEWVLLGTGRLIIFPAQQQAIVLDNVLRINQVEDRMKELLSTLSVSIYPAAGKTAKT